MTDPRRYKGFTPKAGVYRITHLPSGRTLLGASGHAQAILNRISWQLEMKVPSIQRVNSHTLTAVPCDWESDGQTTFVFEVLAPDNSGEIDPAD